MQLMIWFALWDWTQIELTVTLANSTYVGIENNAE